MCKRSVDVESLLRNVLLTIRRKMFQRPHVVQAVGQLDEDDAYVVRHREHHLSDVLRLPLLAASQIDLRDLRYAVNDMSDRGAEFLLNLAVCNVGVFHCVVQQSGGDRRGIQLHFCQHQRYFEGMDQIRLAGSASLPIVVLEGELVGALDDVEVISRTVLANQVQQVTEFSRRKNVGRDLLAQCRHD